MEDRAEEELRLGKYQEFGGIRELIADLHSVSLFVCPWCGLVFYPESTTDIHCLANST